MTEMELTRELGELQRNFSLTDKSEENIKRGERIKEIRKELNLISESRKNKRPAKIVNR